jgi:hypothetical protein
MELDFLHGPTSLVEQKRVLILYAGENRLLLSTGSQWLFVECPISVLSPIERAARDISAEASSASDVIPTVVGIKRSLQLVTDDNTRVQTMKYEVIDDTNNRFVIRSYRGLCCGTLSVLWRGGARTGKITIS